jgi:ribosomal protein S27AE
MAPDQEVRYCTKCGNTIGGEVVRQHYCPFCGAPDEGKKFCPECGGNLSLVGPAAAHAGPTTPTAHAKPVTAAVAAAPAAGPSPAAKPATPAQSTTSLCPVCGSGLFYVAQYNQWYCNSCKAYRIPSTGAKPAGAPGH